MGLFDEADELYQPDEEKPSGKVNRKELLKQELRGMKASQYDDGSPQTTDLMRAEFGLHNWSGKKMLAVVGVFVVVVIIFILKFGTDPGTINDRVRNLFGKGPESVAAAVVHTPKAVDTIQVQDNSGAVDTAKILGVATPTSCYRRASARALPGLLPRGRTIKLTFSPSLGRKTDAGIVQAQMKAGGKDVGVSLVQAGAAKLSSNYKDAPNSAALRKASRSAKRRHAGCA